MVAHDFHEAGYLAVPALQSEEPAAEEQHELREQLRLHAPEHRHHLVGQLPANAGKKERGEQTKEERNEGRNAEIERKERNMNE